MAEVSKQQEVLWCLYLCVKPPICFTWTSLPLCCVCRVQFTTLPRAAMCWHTFRNRATRLNFQWAIQKKSVQRRHTSCSHPANIVCVQRAQAISFAVWHMLFLITSELFLVCSSTTFFHTPPRKGLQRFHSAWKKKKNCARRCWYDDTFHAVCFI